MDGAGIPFALLLGDTFFHRFRSFHAKGDLQWIKPNKLNDRDKRRIESIRERLRAQGVGEDEATKRAVAEVRVSLKSGPSTAAGGGRAPNRAAGNEIASPSFPVVGPLRSVPAAPQRHRAGKVLVKPVGFCDNSMIGPLVLRATAPKNPAGPPPCRYQQGNSPKEESR